ncbi:CsbD family protein [Streptomyces sp. NPDC090109]|uniref:CsbD family protein n=1 Tax=unclassified Streptomyces TaxID=2593676 RepID=UPI00136C21F4|nr:CsbD family protein [Streptomyces sp. SID5770]MZE55539.1 CsbD family protein [Streptomyces sp. SID5770]
MSGATEKIKGKIKEITGKAVGDRRLETEGRTDQARAKAQEALEGARERARGVRDSFKRKRS